MPGISENRPLLSDKDVARLLRMSASWVRQQRFRRRRGEEHVFTVEPVLLGSVPRYWTAEIEEWIDELSNGRAAQ